MAYDTKTVDPVKELAGTNLVLDEVIESLRPTLFHS